VGTAPVESMPVAVAMNFRSPAVQCPEPSRKSRLCSVLGVELDVFRRQVDDQVRVPQTLSPLGVLWLWKSAAIQPEVSTCRTSFAFTSTVLPDSTP